MSEWYSPAVEYLSLKSDPGLFHQHGIGERLACKVMNKSLEKQSILERVLKQATRLDVGFPH